LQIVGAYGTENGFNMCKKMKIYNMQKSDDMKKCELIAKE